jgi:hypothetical protein
MLHLFAIPGLDAGPWGAIAFGAIALSGFVVLVFQVVRYFRNNRDDNDK